MKSFSGALARILRVRIRIQDRYETGSLLKVFSQSIHVRVFSVYKKGLPIPLQLTISLNQSHYNLISKFNHFGSQIKPDFLFSYPINMKTSTILSIITLAFASSASALPGGSGGSGGQCNQGYASCCNGGLCSAALNLVGVGQVCVAPAVFVCCNSIAVLSGAVKQDTCS